MLTSTVRDLQKSHQVLGLPKCLVLCKLHIFMLTKNDVLYYWGLQLVSEGKELEKNAKNAKNSVNLLIFSHFLAIFINF